MASVHKYKRIENSIVKRVKNLAVSITKGVASFFKRLFKMAGSRLTIMVVPHSEKKVYNLHISIFSIACIVLVLVGILGAFAWYGATYSDTRTALADKDSKLKDAQMNLDNLRDNLSILQQSAKGFEAALSKTFQGLGLDKNTPSGNSSTNGSDLSSFFGIQENQEGSLREVENVKHLAQYLNESIKPIEEIGQLIDSQTALLTDIPSMWPIKGGIGHISMFFGQNPNPFTGQYYIHKGIDLSTYRQGDPVIATADGQVVTVDIDLLGYGNYVIIKHKHGFYTRYAHLQSFQVTTGQRVQQGQIIGRIGNTGLTTGPHLHYEVQIGSDVVDPLKYINIRSSIARPGSSR